MPRQTIWRGIERAREGSCLFGKFLEARGLAPDLVRNGGETAVSIGPEADSLTTRRTVTRVGEHLLARQRDLDRVAEHASGQRCQHDLGIDRQLRAEAAADIAADEMDLLGCNLQRCR